MNKRNLYLGLFILLVFLSSCVTPSKKKISSGEKPQLLTKGELKKEIKAGKVLNQASWCPNIFSHR